MQAALTQLIRGSKLLDLGPLENRESFTWSQNTGIVYLCFDFTVTKRTQLFYGRLNFTKRFTAVFFTFFLNFGTPPLRDGISFPWILKPGGLLWHFNEQNEAEVTTHALKLGHKRQHCFLWISSLGHMLLEPRHHFVKMPKQHVEAMCRCS